MGQFIKIDTNKNTTIPVVYIGLYWSEKGKGNREKTSRNEKKEIEMEKKTKQKIIK
jgi:hypothetical protein